MKTADELVTFSVVNTPTGMSIFGVVSYEDEELRILANCLTKLPMNACVVEIGTFAGRSASLYFQLQEELNLDIHLIDVDVIPQARVDFDKMIAQHFNGTPFSYHRMYSERLGGLWKLPIDFLHIDGNHQYEGVNSDCTLWLPHVASKGMVAFHDIVDGNGAPWPPVAEAIDNYVRPTWKHMETAHRAMTWRRP